MQRIFTLAILFGLCSSVPAVSADPWLVFQPAGGTSNGKHIVLVSGDEEYRSEESCPMLAKILSQYHGFKCTVLFAIDKETGGINPYQIDNIPGLEALETADLLVLATRWRVLPHEQLKPVYDYYQQGKPIVAFRTATHAFKSGDYAGYEWANFGLNVIGENWHSHHGEHMVEGGRAVIVEENAGHPILRGVRDIYTPTDIYGIEHLDQEAATILLRGLILQHLDPAAPPVEGEKNNPMMPLAWIKDYLAPSGAKGEVFATTAGAAVDFRSEDLRRLLINACLHLTGQQIPERANVNPVDPYEPPFYGFVDDQLYRDANLRVEEFQLGSSGSAFPNPVTPLESRNSEPEPATAE